MKKLLSTTAALVLLTGAASIAMAERGKDGKEDGAHKSSGHHKGGYFKKVDANADGVITKEENATYHEKKFGEYDTNSDGTITQEEFQAYKDKKRAEYKARKDKSGDDEADDSSDDSMED